MLSPRQGICRSTLVAVVWWLAALLMTPLLRAEEDVGRLARRLRDGETAAVRVTAAERVGAVRPATLFTVSVLLRALDDPHADVRTAAARQLAALAQDPTADVRRLHPLVRPRLAARIVHETVWYAQWVEVIALGEWDGHRTAWELALLLPGDDSDPAAVLRTERELAAAGEDDFAPGTPGNADPFIDLPPIRTALTTAQQAELVETIRQVGHRRPVTIENAKWLTDFLDSPEPLLQLRAIVSLEEMGRAAHGDDRRIALPKRDVNSIYGQIESWEWRWEREHRSVVSGYDLAREPFDGTAVLGPTQQTTEAMAHAGERAVAAWKVEEGKVPWVKHPTWLSAHSTILKKFAEDAGPAWDPRYFDDVLSRSQVASLRVGPRFERYPAPPSLPESLPSVLDAVAAADLPAAFWAATPAAKVATLWFFQTDGTHHYPELLAAALLDADWRVRATASRILWELDGDAEIANALGYAMRHGLAREHVAELVDRIPSDAVYSVPLLRRAYSRQDPRTIGACAEAIGRLGLKGEPERAFFARANADDETGLTFARTFDRHGRAEGLAALLRLAKSAAAPEIRAAALGAIGSAPRSPEVHKELLGMLTGKDAAPLVVEIAAAEAVLRLLPGDHPARPATARLLYLRQLRWTSEVLTDMIAQQRRVHEQTERESLKDLGLEGLLD